MRFFAVLLAIPIFLAAAPIARGDEISDSITSADKLYQDGRLSKAASELNYAAAQIGKKLNQAYLATLPEAPAGWKALPSRDRGQSAAVFTTGQIINKSYRQDGGKGTVKAQLVVDNPMLQALSGMFGNPTMAARMGYDRVSVPGVEEKAYLKWQEDRRTGEIVLVMGGRVFIKLSGRNLESPDVLKEMMRAWDVKKLKQIAELK